MNRPQIVAAMYKKLLYSKTEPKHGGWLLLARRLYQWNQFRGYLLSPEEMGLKRIEPKYFMDPDYNK